MTSVSTFASEKSRSIIFTPDRTGIISANFDAGSVSIIDRKSGEIIKEALIGKDIRRIAMDDGGKVLLATDYLNAQLILLDAQSLKVLKQIPVPNRPFGVIYNASRQQFYVTSFEQHQLLTLNLEGEIISQTETATTPRGLALTDDNRLLVTHALTGQVSIFDVSGKEPGLLKVIQLADSPRLSEKTTPQGKPRLLDNIAISPDGKTAWLPHVLWSFGHDFQFQSTVFPTISILDLTPGKEQEKIERRKQLFKQINIIESGNKVRIVSNPHDAEFVPDSKKVVVSLAGSEDLLAFDLSRQNLQTSNNKRSRKKRHRRKKLQGGVKATQIFRNVPGDNPRGLLVAGRELFVQNAMSLDLAKFDTGAPGPFAKIKLANQQFAKLVQRDPLSKQIRLGKTLFNSANTAEHGQFPMAGDFWMSCNSCHLDGFNFTNKQLMLDAGKDKFSNATTGHLDPIKMIAGDPIAAYIDIIQKTQGGMGADTTAPNIAKAQPSQPSIEVAKRMSALNSYVRTQENLPYLSTWLRLDDDRPYTHPDDWLSSAQCKDCHTTIYDQWADSNHGMNMDHPYYRFQEDLAAREEGEEFRLFCRGCHAPQMVLNRDNAPLTDFGDIYDRKAEALNTVYRHGRSVSERGTGCLFCHRITKVENAGGNADLTVNLKDRNGYLFEGEKQAILDWLSDKQVNAAPIEHKRSYSNPELYQDSLYCASCHNEFSSGPGANINDNYGEWLASPFNAPDDPSQHKSCIDCHMTQDVENFNNRVAGQSTNNGPVKSNLRSHHFTGGNYYLTGLRSEEHKKLSDDLLKNALTLEMSKQDNELSVAITNSNSGHDMPGGSRRQVWLEVIVNDANGERVFESGVMTKGMVPKEARKFEKIGVDKNDEPVGLRFWRYFKIGKDTRIKSGETREEAFQLPENMTYPITVSSRVLYQVFGKELTQQVRAAYPDQRLPEPEVIEMSKKIETYNK